MRKIRVLFSICVCASVVSGQRGSFAGTRPIGFPELVNRTTTEGLGNRFGEGDGTTQRLPVEALGDRDLVDRLSKLPLDKQPFWFINWQALEQHRQNPQTFPQRPSPFNEPAIPVTDNRPSNFNTNPGPINSNPAIPNRNFAAANSNTAASSNSNAGTSSGVSNIGLNNRNGGVSDENSSSSEEHSKESSENYNNKKNIHPHHEKHYGAKIN